MNNCWIDSIFFKEIFLRFFNTKNGCDGILPFVLKTAWGQINQKYFNSLNNIFCAFLNSLIIREKFSTLELKSKEKQTEKSFFLEYSVWITIFNKFKLSRSGHQPKKKLTGSFFGNIVNSLSHFELVKIADCTLV